MHYSKSRLLRVVVCICRAHCPMWWISAWDIWKEEAEQTVTWLSGDTERKHRWGTSKSPVYSWGSGFTVSYWQTASKSALNRHLCLYIRQEWASNMTIGHKSIILTALSWYASVKMSFLSKSSMFWAAPLL